MRILIEPGIPSIPPKLFNCHDIGQHMTSWKPLTPFCKKSRRRGGVGVDNYVDATACADYVNTYNFF